LSCPFSLVFQKAAGVPVADSEKYLA